MSFITKLFHSVIVMLISMNTLAEVSTIGKVYPIQEQDALEEIEQRAKNVNWSEVSKKKQSSWEAERSLKLPLAQENTSRQYFPYYQVEFDVTDAKGKIIYPKGFKYNPLDHVTLPSRIVVINEGHATWFKNHLKVNDMVIISSGNRVETSKVLGVPVFILDKKTKDRLSINYVPTIIEQKINYLIISEFKVEEEFPSE